MYNYACAIDVLSCTSERNCALRNSKTEFIEDLTATNLALTGIEVGK